MFGRCLRTSLRARADPPTCRRMRHWASRGAPACPRHLQKGSDARARNRAIHAERESTDRVEISVKGAQARGPKHRSGDSPIDALAAWQRGEESVELAQMLHVGG